ncbi:VCBS repeat-containing protein [Burkholderiaceae bacterium DAT-1]|nr:VCBS repeat-containing protein [Burkholderiaceae bacterium DAT-1]
MRSDTRSLGASILALTLLSTAHARPVDGWLRVTAAFSPNNAVAGQSVTFNYSVLSDAGDPECSVSGIPGYNGADSSYTFTAASSLTARITCTDSSMTRSVSANLTVQAGNPAPTVSVGYSPSAIYTGQSSTLSWSSQYATSCSSTGSASISSTSGSQSVTPSSNQSVTVTCSGPGGSNSQTANLTVSPPPPPAPTVIVIPTPSTLWGPGWVTFANIVQNATNCGGSAMGMQYVTMSQMFMLTCSGPGGSTTGIGWVTVFPPIGGNSVAPQTTPTLPAAEKAPNLMPLGISLKSKSMSFFRPDLNGDGLKDLIVFDSSSRTAYVLLNRNGSFPRIDKTIPHINALQSIRSVTVPPVDGHAISVSTDK